ncbi:hypothetical protein [Desulfobulbus alkaliphilus]|uniref:hypothetical protein n=1 Tax=Desulfobulbus alkaliphilus TaxID=869814 RepID=UPI001963E7B9|nr:hypothetical protein [Desulfobulbus alkaliphilus]MBM9535973.1 hypothetical protein [Desulfobulbus alkaliphilus]
MVGGLIAREAKALRQQNRECGMGIEKDLSKRMKSEVDDLFCESSSGKVELREVEYYVSHHGLDGPLESFLDQPIDTFPEEPRAELINVLGTYSHMHSPGRIVLVKDNIRRYFWRTCSTILNNYPSIWITRNDLKNTVDVIVLKVWWHEQFHFCCDVFRQLFQSQFNPLIEEALAVAYSRSQVLNARQSSRSTISRIHPQFFQIFMKIVYSYKSPGYRDWHLYGDPVRFGQGLTVYAMNNGKVLSSNGVDVPRMLMDIIASLLAKENSGYIEEIV